MKICNYNNYTSQKSDLKWTPDNNGGGGVVHLDWHYQVVSSSITCRTQLKDAATRPGSHKHCQFIKPCNKVQLIDTLLQIQVSFGVRWSPIYVKFSRVLTSNQYFLWIDSECFVQYRYMETITLNTVKVLLLLDTRNKRGAYKRPEDIGLQSNSSHAPHPYSMHSFLTYSKLVWK